MAEATQPICSSAIAYWILTNHKKNKTGLSDWIECENNASLTLFPEQLDLQRNCVSEMSFPT